jgi:hypothetical protein
MSLQERAQQHISQRNAGGPDESQGIARPIQVFNKNVWGIVDDEVVKVLAITEEQGMSLAYLCVNPLTGENAPVSFTETRIFPGLNYRAVQEQLTQGGQSSQTRSQQRQTTTR